MELQELLPNRSLHHRMKRRLLEMQLGDSCSVSKEDTVACRNLLIVLTRVVNKKGLTAKWSMVRDYTKLKKFIQEGKTVQDLPYKIYRVQ